jgi:Tfp pilus assembly protein PilO
MWRGTTEEPGEDLRRSRRQVLIRIIERVGVALILLDLLLYVAMLRPVQNLVSSEQQRFEAARRRIREDKARVERLERFQEALPGAGENVDVFKRNHVPPRRRGFSRAARLVRRVTEQSGSQLTGITYRLNADHDEPLERLGIEINVEGSFSSLLKFAHALETASDFIVIREFSFEPAEGSTLALRLAADLYLTP